MQSCSVNNSSSFKSNEVEPQNLVLSSAELGSYNLLFNVPKGWKKAFHNNLPGGFITEFIPEKEDLASWEDMISLTLKGVIFTPDYKEAHEIILASSPLNETTCKNFKRSELKDYEQNGLKTIEHYIECPSTSFRPGAGEAMLYKNILAGDKVGLITIWKSWKIKDQNDLQRARKEYAKYTELFRTIDLKKYN